MSEPSKEEMLASLKEWRDKLVEDNRASESTDFWNEEENGDQTMYLAIRRLISEAPEKGKPKVSREFVVQLAGEVSTCNFQKKPPNEVFDFFLKRFHEAGIEVKDFGKGG
jgi:hypothetical protein